jgi:hypothetical protein
MVTGRVETGSSIDSRGGRDKAAVPGPLLPCRVAGAKGVTQAL